VNSTVIVALVGVLSSILVAFLGYNYTEDSKRSWNKTDDIWKALLDSTTTLVKDVKEMQLVLVAYDELTYLEPIKTQSVAKEKGRARAMLVDEAGKPRPVKSLYIDNFISSYGEWLMLTYPEFFKEDSEPVKTTREDTTSEKVTGEPETVKPGKLHTIAERVIPGKAEAGKTKVDTESDKTTKVTTESTTSTKVDTELAKNIRNIFEDKMNAKKLESIRLSLLSILDAEYWRLHIEINENRTRLGIVSVFSYQINTTIAKLTERMAAARTGILSDPEYFKSTSNANEGESNLSEIRRLIMHLQDLCKRELEIARTGTRDKYGKVAMSVSEYSEEATSATSNNGKRPGKPGSGAKGGSTMTEGITREDLT
jgi:hypothetical protein